MRNDCPLMRIGLVLCSTLLLSACDDRPLEITLEGPTTVSATRIQRPEGESFRCMPVMISARASGGGKHASAQWTTTTVSFEDLTGKQSFTPSHHYPPQPTYWWGSDRIARGEVREGTFGVEAITPVRVTMEFRYRVLERNGPTEPSSERAVSFSYTCQ